MDEYGPRHPSAVCTQRRPRPARRRRLAARGHRDRHALDKRTCGWRMSLYGPAQPGVEEEELPLLHGHDIEEQRARGGTARGWGGSVMTSTLRNSARCWTETFRQRDLVPPQRLAACRAVVVGRGGRWGGRSPSNSRATGRSGARPDRPRRRGGRKTSRRRGYRPAGPRPPQGFTAAGWRSVRSLSPDLKLTCHGRFPSGAPPPARSSASARRRGEVALFCCVDSIAARQLLWESTRHQLRFFVDGRMAAEVLRVLAVGHPASDDDYVKSLFAPERAYAGIVYRQVHASTRPSIVCGASWSGNGPSGCAGFAAGAGPLAQPLVGGVERPLAVPPLFPRPVSVSKSTPRRYIRPQHGRAVRLAR